MSKKLHLVPKIRSATEQKFDKAMGCLTLSKAGEFTVEIILNGESNKGAPKELPPFKKMPQEAYRKMPEGKTKRAYAANLKKREAEEAKYAKEKAIFKKNLD